MILAASLTTGCAHLPDAIRAALPADAQSIHVDELAGEVRLVVGYDTPDGDHHQITLLCLAAGHDLDSETLRFFDWKCGLSYDGIDLVGVGGRDNEVDATLGGGQ